uniref:Estradiol 17-beta-dehydrogenase 11 n=1 Tax=Gallus gallus TaxID=9031 RepID=A0A8V0XK46_CHICK
MNPALELLVFLGTLLYAYAEALVKLLLPAKRKAVRGELVLVTGAARGLGRATAREFARHQSRLVLWDVEAHGLKETAAECEGLGASVHTFVVDCSKREEIYSAAEKVCCGFGHKKDTACSYLQENHPKNYYSQLCTACVTKRRSPTHLLVQKVKKDIGDVSILVNNAGVIAAADLLSTQDHQVEKTFEVNILAHIWTTRAFLPTMMNNNHGHIVTVASAAGHFVIPFMVAYCASKFAAVGFHKALTDELSSLGKDGIKTTCLCPVFINTGFVKNPSMRLGKILEVDEVVKALMEGILTNQKMVFVPSNQRFALLLERLLPERALNYLKKLTDVKFDAIVGHGSNQ